jgi:hypothetical protein
MDTTKAEPRLANSYENPPSVCGDFHRYQTAMTSCSQFRLARTVE